MLDKLAEIAAKERKEREALEAPAIEGQYRDVTVSRAEPSETTSPQPETTLARIPPQPPESSPKKPAPPAKQPARGKGSTPPPSAESPRQVRRF
jgi:hypothetical protein